MKNHEFILDSLAVDFERRQPKLGDEAGASEHANFSKTHSKTAFEVAQEKTNDQHRYLYNRLLSKPSESECLAGLNVPRCGRRVVLNLPRPSIEATRQKADFEELREKSSAPMVGKMGSVCNTQLVAGAVINECLELNASRVDKQYAELCVKSDKKGGSGSGTNSQCLHKLLSAKMCHDFSTPLNSLGMTLEMIAANTAIDITDEYTNILQKSYVSLVNLVNLYRILFSQNEDCLQEKCIKVINSICTLKEIKCNVDVVTTVEHTVWKAVVGLFATFVWSLYSGDRVTIGATQPITADQPDALLAGSICQPAIGPGNRSKSQVENDAVLQLPLCIMFCSNRTSLQKHFLSIQELAHLLCSDSRFAAYTLAMHTICSAGLAHKASVDEKSVKFLIFQ
jgi:hypothetical protein